MGLSGCMKCIKYCLFVFNLLFWIIGCALLGVGIWIVVDSKKFMDVLSANAPDIGTQFANNEATVRGLGIAAIVLGGIILILGFLACCGAIRENQAMLAIFFTFLILLFCCLIVIGILVFVFGNTVKGLLKDQLEHEANSTTEYKDGLLSYANNRFSCCGIDDQPVCPKNYPPFVNCTAGSQKCQLGCLNPMWEGFNKLKIGLGIALLVAGGLMMFGMIFSMCLCCAIKNSYDEPATSINLHSYNRYH